MYMQFDFTDLDEVYRVVDTAAENDIPISFRTIKGEPNAYRVKWIVSAEGLDPVFVACMTANSSTLVFE